MITWTRRRDDWCWVGQIDGKPWFRVCLIVESYSLECLENHYQGSSFGPYFSEFDEAQAAAEHLIPELYLLSLLAPQAPITVVP